MNNNLTSNPILQSISNWFQRNFSNPAAVSLFLTIVFAVLFFYFFGKMLLPVLVAVVIVYLLYPLVKSLERARIPHLLAVGIVFTLFVGLIALSLVALLPLLARELSNLINEAPGAFTRSQDWINTFILRYPKLFSDIQISHVISFMREQFVTSGQVVLKYSLATIPGLVQVIIYFVLVPLLVFFFLKDSDLILNWFNRFMPTERSLVVQVWAEVNEKMGAYIKGRVIEIIIVGFFTSVTFAVLGLPYAVLLGSLVGLSAIIPYVGGILVTIPVVIVGLMEWGLSAHFVYLMIAYGLITIVDANILAPLLLAGTMNLSATAIILSVIIFGALWGFWGVFFAIPLATLVNAILKAWPKSQIDTVH